MLKDVRIEVGRFQNYAIGIYTSGEETLLFSYYTDELEFSWYEFTGLTRSQAIDLFIKKDIAYLRS